MYNTLTTFLLDWKVFIGRISCEVFRAIVLARMTEALMMREKVLCVSSDETAKWQLGPASLRAF